MAQIIADKQVFHSHVENDYSDPGNLTCGVTQDSILGPRLFLLNINDIQSVIQCELLLYVDDSVLLFSHKNISTINDQLKTSIPYESGLWLISLVSTQEMTKRKIILFTSKNNK